eukprot:3660824-Pyramimonas_sp.AAC.1
MGKYGCGESRETNHFPRASEDIGSPPIGRAPPVNPTPFVGAPVWARPLSGSRQQSIIYPK